jgi:hypothetical protein
MEDALRDEAVGRLIVNADIRRSSEFNDRAKIRVRKLLYAVVGTAFTAIGVGPDDRHLEDRGDGILDHAGSAGRVAPVSRALSSTDGAETC